ncbi:hypothetical protein IV203_004571 [Nitzschia inconspicua]|uniref:Cytochrome b5 n=1 Tax=Nitzschia inconspicua TaxID=303405 RepID=A0A9K3L5H0_9STRA|nr:hypothetical protein IV203_004571 [Nitzschia inconspicua]
MWRKPLRLMSCTIKRMAIIISYFRQETENEYLLDVSHPEDLDFSCTDTDLATVGFEVNDLDNQELCWRNVHIDNGNIFDFTSWTMAHPGNSAAREPISEVAEAGNTTLLLGVALE